MKRFAVPAMVTFGVALLFASLLLLSKATQNPDEFGNLQFVILLINVLGVLALLVVISSNLVELVREYRNRAPGARLKARMVAVFVVLAIVPLGLVYYFSLQFLNRGIDSWFNVEIEQALDSSLELSRLSLRLPMREYLRHTEESAATLASIDAPLQIAALDDLRREMTADEVVVVGANSRVIGFSSDAGGIDISPDLPTENAVRQVRQGRPFLSLDPTPDGGYRIVVATALPSTSPTDEIRILQSSFRISEPVSRRANQVESAFERYRKLALLRAPLKAGFILTLTLALLLSLFGAVWAAFFFARRLVAPIQDLVAGTRAVAKGDLDTRLKVETHDDMGYLVNSFNDMTSRLALARQQLEENRELIENERANLAVVLARLSTGVIALEPDGTLRVANQAATTILDANLDSASGTDLDTLAVQHPLLGQLIAVYRQNESQGISEWREELTLNSDVGRRVLMCACTRLPAAADSQGGQVIVFDEITELLQAQRDAAWGEVARRLAHEIKNPLTPIQLSAERMRQRFLKDMSDDDARFLERSVHTIVQQVEAMKEMVNAFSEYARAPKMEWSQLDINRLIREVGDLYALRRQSATLTLDFDNELPHVEADPGRIRQVLHNLIRNAFEALGDKSEGHVRITTRLITEHDCRLAEIVVEDNGPGFPRDVVEQAFEPYVTTKMKGTGLGLAIVKKLVEEHSGRILTENPPSGGARVVLRLPVDEDARAALLARTVTRLEYRRERA